MKFNGRTQNFEIYNGIEQINLFFSFGDDDMGREVGEGN